MKKIIVLLLLITMLLSGCRDIQVQSSVINSNTPLNQTEYNGGITISDTSINSQTSDISIESTTNNQLIESSVSAAFTETSEGWVNIEVVDGPSILNVDDITYDYGDKSNRQYQPELSVPPSDDPNKTKIEEEAKEVCDAFFQIYCQSMTQKEELDLSSLYDLSNEIRVLDWEFNQAYIYGDLKLKVQNREDFLSVSYDGSDFYYNWDEWDIEKDNGLLLVHTKTDMTWYYTGDFQQKLSGRDSPVHTGEFALTRVDGQLKVIRYRYFHGNYMGLQQRMADRPEMAKDMREFRAYMDSYLD